MEDFITKVKSIRGLPYILLAALAGVILLVIGNTAVEKKQPPVQTESITGEAEREYAASLEERIEKLLSGMRDVGEVNVMVTLKSGNEYLYAQDTKNGGSEYVINDGLPVLLRQNYPAVAGVAVIVKNGKAGDTVRLEITEMLSALLGIPANRIYV